MKIVILYWMLLGLALVATACSKDPGRPAGIPFSMGTPACQGGDVCKGDN